MQNFPLGLSRPHTYSSEIHIYLLANHVLPKLILRTASLYYKALLTTLILLLLSGTQSPCNTPLIYITFLMYYSSLLPVLRFISLYLKRNNFFQAPICSKTYDACFSQRKPHQFPIKLPKRNTHIIPN